MATQKLINQVAQEIVNEYPNGNIHLDNVIESALEGVFIDEWEMNGDVTDLVEKFANNQNFLDKVTDKCFDLYYD